MKLSSITLVLSALLFFSTTSSFAQVRKIPATVTEAFKDKYPQASNVEWRDKLSAFVVVFEDNSTNMKPVSIAKANGRILKKKLKKVHYLKM